MNDRLMTGAFHRKVRGQDLQCVQESQGAEVRKRSRHQELGAFLRARRAELSPEMVGLPRGMRRRTPGLRREEVAELAAVGVGWYTWLEQGRDINVSVQVLSSIARALLMDDDARDHLFFLASGAPPPTPGLLGEIQPSCVHQAILDALDPFPALVHDPLWNIVACNEAFAHATGAKHDLDDDPNLMWLLMTNERVRTVFPDWELHAKFFVALFRRETALVIEDPRTAGLIERLRSESSEFNQWWSCYDFVSYSGIHSEWNHDEVGMLQLDVTYAQLTGGSGLELVTYTPATGTETAEKLEVLAAARHGSLPAHESPLAAAV